MPDELPAFEYAKSVLAQSGVMTPEQLLDEVEPGPALVFLRECIVMVTAILAGSVVDAEAPPPEAEEAFSGAAVGLAQALLGITHALVELRVLPTEALEALETADASTTPKGA
jgi:hypothetical protein